MTANHTHFEFMCALAASGQLTSLELAKLHEHSECCSSCSDRLVELTDVSAKLFCAHFVNQPASRMPKEMMVRFIARANGEGIPLNPRTESASLSLPAWTAAFVFAILLVSVALHIGFQTRTVDGTMRSDITKVSTSMGDRGEASPGSQTKIAVGEPHGGIAARRQRSRGNGSEIPLLASQANRRVFRYKSTGLEHSQFTPTAYPHTLAILRLPFIVAAKLDPNIQWAPARYGAPRFPFVESSDFARDDSPRLLAGYERRPFAPWSTTDNLAIDPADMQTLRHDFDPNGYRSLLNHDFKRNLPVFQFSENAQQ